MYKVDFKDDKLEIKVNLAGYGKEDVEVSFVDNYLKLKYGEKEDEQYLGYLMKRVERFSGKKLDIDKVKAEMRHGLLTLTIPTEEEKKFLIDIM